MTRGIAVAVSLAMGLALLPAPGAAAGPSAQGPAAGPGYTEGGATGGGLHTAFPGTPLGPAGAAAVEDAFLAHVTANPGQRMEQIAKALGLVTPELTLPVRKLLADGKIRVQGQKRATEYFPADSSGSAKTARAAKGTGVKAKRGRGRPKKKAA